MMKGRIVLLLVAFTAILVTSCAQNKKLTGGENLKRQWMLKALPGFSSEELMKARAEINLSDLTKTGAYAGCNRIMFATTTGKDRSISFTGIAATKMFCAENMKVENVLLETLPLIKTYEIKGHHIVFYGADGKMLVSAVAADWD